MIRSIGKPSGAIFFYHGTGDTGAGLKDWVTGLTDFTFKRLNVYFPTSRVISYRPHDGDRINVWFDREGESINSRENLESITNSAGTLKQQVISEINKNGISANRIFFGGFSMGGSMALHMGYCVYPSAAGVFAISSYLSNDSIVYDSLMTRSPPLFMSHGDADDIVNYEWGASTFKKLSAAGIHGNFSTYPGVEHELTKKGLEEVKSWIRTVLDR